MTAIFHFEAALLVLLLIICTSTYAHQIVPGWIDKGKDSIWLGPLYKAARVGERLSPYVSICCLIMAVRTFTS